MIPINIILFTIILQLEHYKKIQHVVNQEKTHDALHLAKQYLNLWVGLFPNIADYHYTS